MFKVYILKSSIKERYYIGCTSELDARLRLHNAGKVSSTKAYKSWTVTYFEKFRNRRDAFSRERQIKSYKGGVAFKKLIDK